MSPHLSSPAVGAVSEPTSQVVVPDLTSSTLKGDRYERTPEVLAEIRKTLRLCQSEWMAAAEHLRSETLVFLFRHVRGGDDDLDACLLQELTRRIHTIANKWIWRVDPASHEHIALQVEIEILELVMAATPSRQTEILEITFGSAVERRTINAWKKHTRAQRRETVDSAEDVLDDDEVEDSIASMVDPSPGPEAQLIELQEEARRSELVRRAAGAVKDSRRLEVFILHHCYDWPITSKDPNRPSLARRFNATPRQIKYWIDTAMEAMRAAIGDEK